MTDAREALVGVIAGSECDWRDATPESIADAILTGSDVTERGEGAAMSACISTHGGHSFHAPDDEFTCTVCGVLDEDALRAELVRLRSATTLPSVEDVARQIDPEAFDFPEECAGDIEVATDAAARVLALLPGRTEAEVKAEERRAAYSEWFCKEPEFQRGYWLVPCDGGCVDGVYALPAPDGGQPCVECRGTGYKPLCMADPYRDGGA